MKGVVMPDYERQVSSWICIACADRSTVGVINEDGTEKEEGSNYELPPANHESLRLLMIFMGVDSSFPSKDLLDPYVKSHSEIFSDRLIRQFGDLGHSIMRGKCAKLQRKPP
jgi:hypothetical protein